MQENEKTTCITKILLILIPIVLFFISMCLGRYSVNIKNVFGILFSPFLKIDSSWKAVEESIVLNIRFPRIILSMVIGGGLAISGASFQGLFGNPLVSPHILGVSAGAGFGAALGLLLANNFSLVQFSSLAFGVLAVFISYLLSNRKKTTAIYALVLSGVITGAFFQALISFIKYIADPEDKLPQIVYWLMGSLTGTSYRDLLIGLPLIVIGIIILWGLSWRINILSLPEEEAKSLGVNVKLLKTLIIGASTLITATSVSLCGIIGWIGLVIPHIGRMLVGNNHKKLLPACVSIGASYLLLIDCMARSISAAEIPLSILTAIIGAPFFAMLLRKTGGAWK